MNRLNVFSICSTTVLLALSGCAADATGLSADSNDTPASRAAEPVQVKDQAPAPSQQEEARSAMPQVSASNVVATEVRAAKSVTTLRGNPAQANIVRPDSVAYGGPDLLWQNTDTGEIATWQLDGKGTVTGTQQLKAACGSAGACASSWLPIDTQSNSILWDNPTTGKIEAWAFDNSGNVSIDPALSWTCDAASGCSSAWHPIGRVGGLTGSGQKQPGLLWHDRSSGELAFWDLSANAVTGKHTLVGAVSGGAWTCGAGCADVWQAVLTTDINNDGNTDVLWFNRTTGAVAAWLLNSAGAATGSQTLSWTCNAASGCASSWDIVGAADVNGDGHTDITWFDASSGQVASWLLDGTGKVTGTQVLSSTCSTASGCAPSWRPLGYVSFPSTSISFHWGEDDFGGGGLHGVDLTINSDGSYAFSGAFWENTFPGCNPGVNDATVVAVQAANGQVLTFSRSGSMSGCGSQNDNWSITGTNPAIVSAWPDLQLPRVTAYQQSSFSVNFGSLWSAIVAAIQVVGQVVSIVGSVS